MKIDWGLIAQAGIVILIIGAFLAMAYVKTDVEYPCEYNFSVKWSTGGYAPSKGYVMAESVEFLDNGGVSGIATKTCGEFYVHGGDAVIKVSSNGNN